MPTGVDLDELVRLRSARDLVDRDFAEPLDVTTLARHALMSPAHFSRRFRAAYGETPHRYLMTRRIERAMALLRAGSSVTDACTAVGCSSLGSFSSSFRALVGEPPSAYRARRHEDLAGLPGCLVRLVARPRATQGAPSRASGAAEVARS